MLCDELGRFASNPVGVVGPAQARSLRELYACVKTAKRYVMSKDFAFTVHNVAEMKPTQHIAALNLCRLPAQRVWVEFAHSFRVEWRAIQNIRMQERPDAPYPVRLGYYMEQQDENTIGLVLSWMHKDGSVHICPIGLLITTTPHFPVPSDWLTRMESLKGFMDQNKSPFSWLQRYINDPKELAAGTELEHRITVAIPPFLSGVWSEFELIEKVTQTPIVDYMIEAARYDIGGEWRMALAILMLLNSKSCVTSSYVDVSKINKSRAKKKQQLLLDYYNLDIELSKVQSNRMSGMSARERRAHLVSGHFKVRKTGIFWWSSHVRRK